METVRWGQGFGRQGFGRQGGRKSVEKCLKVSKKHVKTHFDRKKNGRKISIFDFFWVDFEVDFEIWPSARSQI